MNSERGVGSWALLGAYLGLAAGMIELGLAVAPALMPGSSWPGMFHVSPHWLWLKPLADAALGAAIAFAGALLHRAAPRGVTPRVVLWMVTTGVLLSVVMPYRPTVGGASLAIFAAGAAVPLSRVLARRASRIGSHRGAAISAVVVVCLIAAGTALAVVPGVLEEKARGRLGAPPAGAPNIVLVILDTVRSPVLAPTDRGLDALPNIARLAAGGVQFRQAIATSSWTLESHASMFTGWYPMHVFTDGRTPLNFETPFPRGIPTLAEALVRHGYVTGGFVANTNYTDREHGLDRGFLHYDDYPLRWGDVVASSALGHKALEKLMRWQGRPVPVGQRTAGQVTASFLDWFDRQEGRPVFAFLNYFDAHDPYVPEPGFRTGPVIGNPKINPYYLYPPDETAALKQAYDDCVRYLDHVVGALAAALEQRRALDSTVLVVASDHGEHFGEHDLMSHGNSLYRQSLQVPFVIRYPKAIPGGTSVSAPVTLRDLPATLLELAGAGEEAFPGTSLSPLWTGAAPARAYSPIVSSVVIGRDKHHFAPANWPVSRGSMRSVVAEGLHYILNGDGVEELYDWAGDLDETRNLAASPGHAAALQRLRAVLKAVEAAPPRRSP